MRCGQADDVRVHDFFRGEDHAFGGKRGFALLAQDAPDVGVAFTVRALDVHDGDVRAKRRNHHHILAPVGVGDAAVSGLAFSRSRAPVWRMGIKGSPLAPHNG